MTLASFAKQNLRGNVLRYAAFVLSSVFSVALFYIYAQLYYHPVLASGDIYGGQTTRTAITVCMFLIALFSIVFITYSTTTFVKSRGTEFGLLTLFGAERGQLGRIVVIEQTVLGTIALVIGLGLGMVFSHLFNLVFARIIGLETGMAFVLSATPIVLTIVGFAVVFAIVSLLAIRRLQRQEIVAQLREQATPKPLPKGNFFALVLGLLLVGSGYGLSLSIGKDDVGAIVLLFFPVVGITTVGTYILFAQLSLVALNIIKRTRGYLSGTRMIVVAQLAYRLRDNARLLASVSLLSAVVFSASGTFYGLMSAVRDSLTETYPVNLQRAEAGTSGYTTFSAEQLAALLHEHNIVPSVFREELLVNGVTTENDYYWLVPEAFYNEVTSSTLELANNEAVRLVAGAHAPFTAASVRELETKYNLSVGEHPGPEPFASFDAVIVLNNQTFARVREAQGERNVARMLVANYAKPTNAFIADVQALVPDGFVEGYANRDVEWQDIMATLALSIFIGLFVSLLFLIGAGSAIYFKLFTELEGDRKTYGALYRIGFTKQELLRTIRQQINVLFFLPFVVGALHSTVALGTLGRSLGANFLPYTMTILALFFVVQLVFALLTQWTYVRAVRPAQYA